MCSVLNGDTESPIGTTSKFILSDLPMVMQQKIKTNKKRSYHLQFAELGLPISLDTARRVHLVNLSMMLQIVQKGRNILSERHSETVAGTTIQYVCKCEESTHLSQEYALTSWVSAKCFKLLF